ncbi:hypothetical protein [Shewanella subflava]|uniref:Uncharacterized protein n=1 Tax=Shewanella subflava TaxID=2986476 RepID=A0ABT3I596_9GAMM|nr:hypothetical protein [Shewanella subflava]MCW3171241.1 hypothetical protein [Shewanella subflava]
MSVIRFKAPKTCHVMSNGALVQYVDYRKIEVERDALAVAYGKLESLAMQFIENSEEIIEFFEVSSGRNHLIIARDIRVLADDMVDLLNDKNDSSQGGAA